MNIKIKLNRNNHLEYFILHEIAYNEVLAAYNNIVGDYKDQNYQTMAKVILNIISEKSCDIYNLSYLAKVLDDGLENLPVAIAINNTEDLINQVLKTWAEIPWLPRAMLGFKPTRAAAATYLIATKINNKEMEDINRMNEVDQEIAKLVFGNLYKLTFR